MVYVSSVAGSDDGAVITVSEDKNVLIWLKRDSGGYWPSVHEELPAPATAVAYEPVDKRLYIGLGTGAIVIYAVQEDFNAITYVSAISTHKGRITGLRVDKERELLVSGSRDKMILLHSLETNGIVSSFPVQAWVTAIDYDASAPNIFVGDYSGRVHVLKLSKETRKIELIAPLEEHTGSIRAIKWVRELGMLFTGSNDKTVIMWDIGQCKGEFFTLRGHKAAIDGLAYYKDTKQLITAGSDKKLIVWDVGKHKWTMPPEWSESDTCQLCDVPFFWNVEQMWKEKKVNMIRQHHCRFTGKAVCDKCSPHRTTICSMGFELPVRVCVEAKPLIKEEDLVPRCRVFPLSGVASVMDLVNMQGNHTLVTGNRNGEVCLWEMSAETLSTDAAVLRATTDDREFKAAQAHAAAEVGAFTDVLGGGDDEDRVEHTAVYDTGYSGADGQKDLLSQLDD